MANFHSAPVNMSESDIRKLRRQLETEITWLQRQMEDMSGSSSDVDISLRQTYKEMIFSRRALLGRIPR